ncbi:MAG: DNA polymerase domain-containing protein [Acidimicrobiales bacterium]
MAGDFAPITVEGREMRVSNPGKVFFPEAGVSKMQLVEYYVSVGQGALRGVYRRPTVLKRFPDGINGEVFFQKRVPAARPEWLHTATVSFPSGRSAEELCPLDVAHIVWAVNLGCVDLNPWPVRDSHLDLPDELRVDLDPMPGLGFEPVREVAGCVHEVLDELGLPGFPKTSGSRGIHINVPIKAELGFTDVRAGALALAREVERRMPDVATSKWWKEERGRRVFIDYNQNARDRTVASAYSVRPVPNARVSAPFRWDELGSVDPDSLTVFTVPARVASGGDPAAGADGLASSLRPLLELARRDVEERGLADAPWPPHFAKAPGEPVRARPSVRRARRPAAAGERGGETEKGEEPEEAGQA